MENHHFPREFLWFSYGFPMFYYVQQLQECKREGNSKFQEGLYEEVRDEFDEKTWGFHGHGWNLQLAGWFIFHGKSYENDYFMEKPFKIDGFFHEQSHP